MNTGSEAVASKNGLLTTIAASVGNNVQYALEGSILLRARQFSGSVTNLRL